MEIKTKIIPVNFHKENILMPGTESRLHNIKRTKERQFPLRK